MEINEIIEKIKIYFNFTEIKVETNEFYKYTIRCFVNEVQKIVIHILKDSELFNYDYNKFLDNWDYSYNNNLSDLDNVLKEINDEWKYNYEKMLDISESMLECLNYVPPKRVNGNRTGSEVIVEKIKQFFKYAKVKLTFREEFEYLVLADYVITCYEDSKEKLKVEVNVNDNIFSVEYINSMGKLESIQKNNLSYLDKVLKMVYSDQGNNKDDYDYMLNGYTRGNK